MNKISTLQEKQRAAKAWFDSLRDRIVAELERLEEEAPPELFPGGAGQFELTPWQREAGGGGTMGLIHGRLFEKGGVHVSRVHGPVTAQMAQVMPGKEGETFFATGISLILHPVSPRVPAVHMNTRFICAGEDSWFGGGADLTPVLDIQRSEDAPDAVVFHAAMQKACDAHNPEWHAKYKKWCDEYFFLPHRNEPRGIGGIFYDRHNSGDHERDFAFTRDVGDAFLDVYPRIVRHRLDEPWTAEDREEQLIRRGRYVEFNLLYDRGTMFGLKTGGNIESILSSMPPVVKWP
ncbi:MAG: oxygen-dependent coproporphyrinogen oxidase [Alphaproteobacteria bacterium]